MNGPLRVLFDATPLGRADIAGRAGVHRVIAEVVGQAVRDPDVEIGLTALGDFYERLGLLDELRRLHLGPHVPALPWPGMMVPLGAAIRRWHLEALDRSRRHPRRIIGGLFQRLGTRLPLRHRPPGRWDVFHCLHQIPDRRKGAPVCPRVITVHDLIPVIRPELCDPGYAEGWRCMLDRLDPESDHIVCISEAVLRDLQDLVPGFPTDRMRVIPNGVSPRFAPPTEMEVAALRSHLGLGAHRYLLALGTRDPRKNRRLVEEVFRSLRATHPDLMLLLLGGRAGAGGAGVRELGPVPDRILPTLMGGAALFCFPSLAEGFGLPPLEAMACGAPVLCSDRGALVEVVGDGAVVIDPEDTAAWKNAAHRILDDPAFRFRLVTAGRRAAARYDWKRSWASYRTLYREISRR